MSDIKYHFKNIALTILSAIFSALSFNHPNFSFLIWFSLAPYLAVIFKSRFREGLFYSFLFGYCFYGVMLYWVGNVSVLGLVFLLGYLAFYWVLFFVFGRLFIDKPWRMITLPAIWVVLELLKESIWCGFSWGNLCYSQYTNLFLIQPADLLGAKFISFLIVMANVLAVDIFAKGKNIFKKIILFSFILLLCVTYSVVKINTTKTPAKVKLSVVQPDIAESDKRSSATKESIVESMKELSATTNIDSLVIFPEAGWPALVDDEELPAISDFSKNIGRDILTGAIMYRDGQFSNSALLVDKQGVLKGKYDKIKLVPFGEYVPMRMIFGFIPVLNELGDMRRGSEYKLFSWKEKKFAVLICFEDTMPMLAARFARDSDYLINITNDEWFKGEPEASQHFSVMTMRAVENGVPVARCANTGVSGWVDSLGRINKFNNGGRETFCRGSWSFELPLADKHRTWFNRFPEFFSLICLLFLLIFSVSKIRYKNM